MALNEHERSVAHEFDRGCELRDRGELAAAIDVFKDLIAKLRPDDTTVLVHSYMQLGNIYWKLDLDSEREDAFRQAVVASPRNELASLGLFHALGKLRRGTEGYREMIRLLALRDSALYRELLCDGYERTLVGEDLELVRQARELLEEHSRN
jgi:hypothetical protein